MWINSWIGFLFFGNCPTSKRWANPFTVTPTDRNQHPCRGDLVPMELRRRRFHLSLDGPTDTAGVGWGRHGYVLGGGTYNRYKSLQKSMESALYCRIHRVYTYIYIYISSFMSMAMSWLMMRFATQVWLLLQLWHCDCLYKVQKLNKIRLTIETPTVSTLSAGDLPSL